MANIRVKDLPNTNTAADTDEFIIDSSTAGTRRLSYSELKSEISTDFQGDVNTHKIATLASDNKLDPSQIPDTLSQGLNFVGVANSAGDLTSTTQGDFYVIQTAFDSYQVGDQAVYSGSSYTRVTDGTKQIAEGGTGATTLDAAKVNLEIADVGTAPNEVPLNGQLGSMAYQSSEAVSMGAAEVETLEVTDKIGVGVTTSTAKLHVAGNVKISGETHPTLDLIPATNSGDSIIKFRNTADDGTVAAIKAMQTGGTVDRLAIGCSGLEQLVISAAGEVGVSQSAPGDFAAAANNLVVGSGSGNEGLTIFAASDGEASIYFADGTSGNAQYRSYVVCQHSNDNLVFGTAGSNRWTIDSSGNFVSSGGGIDFGSGASTTLDAYEEGYHETTVGTDGTGSITLYASHDRMTYTKIGNLIQINGMFAITSVSSPTGNVTFSLPVAVPTLTDNAGYVGGAVYFQDYGTSNTAVPFRCDPGTSTMTIFVDSSTLAANDKFAFNFTYRTTAS